MLGALEQLNFILYSYYTTVQGLFSLGVSSLPSSVMEKFPSGQVRFVHLKYRVEQGDASASRSNLVRRVVRLWSLINVLMLFPFHNLLPVISKGNGQVSTEPAPVCHFYREYTADRFYQLDTSSQLPFLADAEYIYGQPPFTLNSDAFDTQQGKVCLMQGRNNRDNETNPILGVRDSSGTNPSFLGKERLQSHLSANHPIMTLFEEHSDDHPRDRAVFLGTVVFKSSTVCSWNPSQRRPHRSKNPRTILMLLNERFEALWEVTISLEKGKRPKKRRLDVLLDDARLFLHRGRVWLSYKQMSKRNGQDLQFFSPLHIEFDQKKNQSIMEDMSRGGISVFVRDSEAINACCGRNMAVLEHPPTKPKGTISHSNDRGDLSSHLTEGGLLYLKQPDPVQITNVTVRRNRKLASKVKDFQDDDDANPEHRKKSHFHGTSGFLLYLPDKDEHLGIGHFHRPNSYDAFSEYAPYGHHYSHAFFTISSGPDFKLKRLSAEFVFGSKQNDGHDAEIIQFASGLELVHRDHSDGPRQYAVIGYGMNDCEGAGIYVSMERVDAMLRPVASGQEVVDLMSKVPTWAVTS